MYRTMGFAHATLAHHGCRLRDRLARDDEGQGTIEYVGLIALLSVVMLAVGGLGRSSGIAKQIVDTVKSTITDVGAGPK
jgi:Flp pilus assembly pilin Flp